MNNNTQRAFLVFVAICSGAWLDLHCFFFFEKTKEALNLKVSRPKARGSSNQVRLKRAGLGLGFYLRSILKSLFIIFHLSFTDFVFTFLFSNTINTLVESQSIDQLRVIFMAILKLYLIALSERLSNQSGTHEFSNHARSMSLATMLDLSAWIWHDI